jgi:hypothetical protein
LSKSFEPVDFFNFFAKIWLSPDFCQNLSKSLEPVAFFVEIWLSPDFR